MAGEVEDTWFGMNLRERRAQQIYGGIVNLIRLVWDEYNDKELAQDMSLLMLEDVWFKHGDKKPTQNSKTYRINPHLRKKVYERDHFKCVQCGSTSNLTLDHIYPRAFGGETTYENLRTMCAKCNKRKGACYNGRRK